jgi:predicted ATPase
VRVVIRLLGGFDVTVDGRPVADEAWQRRSASALVKLLALQPARRLLREQVIDALWLDLLLADAAPRLHKAAHYARAALDTRDAVVLAGNVVTLLPTAQVTVDVVEFEAAANAAGADPDRVAEAAERYGGDLLPDDLFDDWVASARSRLLLRYRQLQRAAGPPAPPNATEPAADGAAEGLELPPVPLPPTVTVGRDRDLERITRLLEESRLVTLTGPGGVGKTRLAVELARGHSRRTGTDACFVDLTRVGDAALVPELVARDLGLQASGAGAERALSEALRHRRLLLVLDNFEHVAEAAGLVAQLLREAAGLRVLCTSRTRLRLAGEQLYDVPPLSLAPVRRTDGGRRGTSPAVALFAQAAGAVDPDFRLAEHAADVAAICRAVDGLPLALELAAGHVRTLTPAHLRSRLAGTLGSPAGATLDSPPRQRTVAATIDWSLQLLDDDDRRLFPRLGVFAGPVPLEAIESVCADTGTDVTASLARLVDASLVRRVPGRGGLRFGLLQLLRERARVLLAENGAVPRSRHAVWVAAEVEDAEDHRWSDVSGPWFDRLTDLLPEVRAAYAWARAHDPVVAARLAAAMGVYWLRAGHLAEGRAWAAESLGAAEQLDDLLLARLRLTAGWVVQGIDLAAAREHWNAAVDGFRVLGHDRYVACALVWSSVGYAHDPAAEDLVRRRCTEGIELARAVGEAGLLIQLLNIPAELARSRGDDNLAHELYEEGCAVARAAGDQGALTVYLSNLGYVAEHRRDFAEARRLEREALRLARSMGRRLPTAWVVGQLAGPETELGSPELAARLVGAADHALAGLAAGRDLFDVPEHERVVAALRTALGDDAYERLHAEGTRMSLDEAADLALGDPRPAR